AVDLPEGPERPAPRVRRPDAGARRGRRAHAGAVHDQPHRPLPGDRLPRPLGSPRMSLASYFRTMARNNAWSNRRLLQACARLSQAEFEAPRTSFFPSLKLTLNHILTVDWYYLDALEARGRGLAVFDDETPCTTTLELRAAQTESDRRL